MDTLHPSPKLIATLKEKYGDTIRQELGITPEALTRPEAEYLARFKTVDSFREKVARAKHAAHPPEGAREEEREYVKGQAALFEEAPPEFELEPTEPTPAQMNHPAWSWTRCLSKLKKFQLSEREKPEILTRKGD